MDNEPKNFNKQKTETTIKKRRKFKTNIGFTQEERRLISKLNEDSDDQIYNETQNQNRNLKTTPKLKKLKKKCNSRSVSKSPNVNRINKQQSLSKNLKKEIDNKIDKENQGYYSDVNMKKVSNNHRKKIIIEFRKKMRYILGTMRYNILLKKCYYHWRNVTYKEKSKNNKTKQTYRNPIIYGPVEHNNDDDYDDSEETQNNKFLMDGQLEEIEERAADEEESVATSVQSKVRYNNRNNIILILRKIIKYKNILHKYFRQWYGVAGIGLSIKEYKKLRKSTKLTGNNSNIKRNSPKNSNTNTNTNIKQTILELDVENYTPEKMAKIQQNIIRFFELGGFKERIEKKYYNIWYRKTIKNNLYKNAKNKKNRASTDSLNNNKKKNNNNNNWDPCKILKKLFIKINNKKLLYHVFKKWNFITKNISDDSKRIKSHVKIQKKELNKDKNTNSNKNEKKTKIKKINDNNENTENSSMEEKKSLTDSRVFYDSDIYHKKIESNGIEEKKRLHPNKSRDDSTKRSMKKLKNTKQKNENNLKMKIDHEERPKYKINPYKITTNENDIKHKEIFEKIKFTKFRHKKNKNRRFLIYNSLIKNSNKKEKNSNNFYCNDNCSDNLLKKLNVLIIKKCMFSDKKAKYFDKWFDSTFDNPKYLPFNYVNYQSNENSSNKVKFSNDTKNNEKHSSLNNYYMNSGKDSMLNLKEYEVEHDKTPKKKNLRKKKKENDNNNIKNNINNLINYSKDDEINPDLAGIEIMQNDEPEIQLEKLNYINNNKFARQLLKILYKNYQQRLKLNQTKILKKYLHKWKRHIQNYITKNLTKKILKFSLIIKKILFKKIRIFLSLKTTRSNTMANVKNKYMKKPPPIDWHELSKDDLRSDQNIKTPTNNEEEEDNFGQSNSGMNSFIQKIEDLMKRKDSNKNANKKLKSKKSNKKIKLFSEKIKQLIKKDNNLKIKFYFDYWVKYTQKIKQKKTNITTKQNKTTMKKIDNNNKIKQEINLLDFNESNEAPEKSFVSSESIENNSCSNNNNKNTNNNKTHPPKKKIEYQEIEESLILPSIRNKSLQKLINENKLTYDTVINNILIKNRDSISSLPTGSNNEESKNDKAGKKSSFTRRSLQRLNICVSLNSNVEEKKWESDKLNSIIKNKNINKQTFEKKKYISNINKLKCDSINIMNKNYEMLYMNSKKYEKIIVPGYLEILKKQNKINSAYQIFCIYAIFKDNNKKDILKKLAFHRWKCCCIFKNGANKIHIQYKCGHCIKCNCNENKYNCFNYSICGECNCKEINEILKKIVIKFKFLKYMNPKKYYFYLWKKNQ